MQIDIYTIQNMKVTVVTPASDNEWLPEELWTSPFGRRAHGIVKHYGSPLELLPDDKRVNLPNPPKIIADIERYGWAIIYQLQGVCFPYMTKPKLNEEIVPWEADENFNLTKFEVEMQCPVCALKHVKNIAVVRFFICEECSQIIEIPPLAPKFA